MLICLILKKDNIGDDGIVLTTDQFKDAVDGFTPASIRNVPLHTAGELGWDDVGGLTDVKSVLIETLQWPSKVCKCKEDIVVKSHCV